jgi:hypothetical protein
MCRPPEGEASPNLPYEPSRVRIDVDHLSAKPPHPVGVSRAAATEHDRVEKSFARRTRVFTSNEKVFTSRRRRSSRAEEEGLHNCKPSSRTRSFESFGSVRPLSLRTGTVIADCVSFAGIGALTALYLRSIGSGHETSSVQYSEPRWLEL